jgi:hypothetical protein
VRTLERGDPRFQGGELLEGPREQPRLDVELLAGHDVEAGETRGEQGTNVLLDVPGGISGGELAHLLGQLVEESVRFHCRSFLRPSQSSTASSTLVASQGTHSEAPNWCAGGSMVPCDSAPLFRCHAA